MPASDGGADSGIGTGCCWRTARRARAFGSFGLVRDARVLRDEGLLAIISYGLCSVAGLEGLIEDFHDRTLKPWWPAARWLVIEGYRSVTLPWPELEGPPPMPLERQWHWQDMAGYLDTWSALVKARDHGDDPLAAFLPVLREHWGEAERTVRWPLQLRVCARPPRPAG